MVKHKRMRLGGCNTAILEGREDLRSWDIDELLMGRRRNRAGDFRGKEPVVVPKAIQDEAVRRVLHDVNAIIQRAGIPAAELLLKNVTEGSDEDTAKAAVELRSAQEVLNRLLGKPREKVDISHEVKPWEKLTATVVNRRDDETDPAPSLPAESDGDERADHNRD